MKDTKNKNQKKKLSYTVFFSALAVLFVALFVTKYFDPGVLGQQDGSAAVGSSVDDIEIATLRKDINNQYVNAAKKFDIVKAEWKASGVLAPGL